MKVGSPALTRGFVRGRIGKSASVMLSYGQCSLLGSAAIYSVTPKRRKTLIKKTQPTPQCVGQGRIFRKAKQHRPVKTHVQRGQDTRWDRHRTDTVRSRKLCNAVTQGFANVLEGW